MFAVNKNQILTSPLTNVEKPEDKPASSEPRKKIRKDAELTFQEPNIVPPNQKINLMASVTVPMTSLYPKTDNLQQNKTPIKQLSTANDKMGGHDKTGGSLPTTVNQDITSRERIVMMKEPADQKNSTVLKDTVEAPCLEKIVDELCFFSKIEANSNLTEVELQKFIDCFSLLADDEKTRKQKLNQLKTPEGRSKLMKFEYLNGESEAIKRNVQLFFYYIIQYFMEANQYANITGVIELINYFLKIYKKKFFVEGKFKQSVLKEAMNINGTIDTNSLMYQQIMKNLEQFKHTILIYYERIFNLFNDKIKSSMQSSPNSTLQKIKKKQSLIMKLSQNIWNGYRNVITSDKKDQYTKQIQHSAEISTFIRGLNCCYAINCKFFDKKLVLNGILPLVIDQIPIFENNRAVSIQQIDKLVLKLFLNKPFDASSKTKEVDDLINDPSMSRYSFLRQLTNYPLKYSQLKPLKSEQNVIFLQKLIQSNRSFEGYDSDKAIFIFQSICQIVKSNLLEFQQNKDNNYRQIMRYIKYIEQGIDNRQQNRKYYNKVVGICRYCKFLNIIMLQPNRQGILIKLQDFTNNKYLPYIILDNILKIITVEEQEFRSIRDELSDDNISIQILYEFMFRLIIMDPCYFANKIQIVTTYFDNLDHFYTQIIINYLQQYAQAYVYQGQNCKICLEALNKIIGEKNCRQNSQNIVKQLSNLELINLQLIDERNNISYTKTKLEFIVQSFAKNQQNYLSLAKHLLSIIRFDEDLLHCAWIEKVSQQLKQISQNYHPYNIPQYGEILIECMKFLQRFPKKLHHVEQHFNFKFISRFLNYVLCLKFDDSKPYNRCIRTSMYSHLMIGVRLLKGMTNLYLKQKQQNAYELVPQQIRKMLELNNKNGSYQLQFGKQAASYSVALVVLSLSKQFASMRNLRQQCPSLKNEIYQTLINLNNINNLLKYENELKIFQIENKQWEHQLNESLRLKKQIVEQIKRKPSYMGLEYIISWGICKIDLKKELFQKIRNVPQETSLDINRIKSHFIYIYWKQITHSSNKVDLNAGWKFVSHELEEITKFLNKLQDRYYTQSQQVLVKILQNIYTFAIILKKTSLEHYTNFMLKYHTIFFRYINKKEQQYEQNYLIKLGSNYRECLLYFFASKSFLPAELYIKFEKQKQIHERIYNFLLSIIRLTYNQNYHSQFNDSILLEIVQHAITFLIDICDQAEDAVVNKWINQLLIALQERPHKPQEMTTKQLLILLLIHGKLSTQISCEEMNFSHQYWMLHLNVLQEDVKFASLVLLDLETMINENPIFFMSGCNYIVKMAKTAQLQYLQTVKDYKNSKNLFNILTTILNRSISGEKSYHVIWIIQILIQILQNQTVEEKYSHEFYANVRFMILSNRFVHQRIEELLAKIAISFGVNSQGIWDNNRNKCQESKSKIAMSQKLELLAYFRLITSIKFNQKYELIKFSVYHSQDTVEYLCQREQIVLKSIVGLIPLLSKIMSVNDVKLVSHTEWQQKLGRFELTSLAFKSLNNSGLQQKYEQDIHKIWCDNSGLDGINELANIQFTSICIIWLSGIIDSTNSQKIHPLLAEQKDLQSRSSDILKLMDVLIRKTEFYYKNQKEIQPIIFNFNQKIYLGSISLTKEMLFTNSSALSSNLNVEYGSIMQKLGQSVIILYKLGKHIQQIFQRGVNKNDSRFKKEFKAIRKQLFKIEQIIKRYDDNFNLKQEEDNFKTQTVSMNKSRTIKNIY